MVQEFESGVVLATGYSDTIILTPYVRARLNHYLPMYVDVVINAGNSIYSRILLYILVNRVYSY